MHTRRSVLRQTLATLLTAALLLAGGVCPAQDLEPSSLAGTWKCKGIDPTNTAYTGTVVIVPEGETYRVTWSIEGAVYTGVGVKISDVFAVSYYGKMSGIIAYQINGKTLIGKWSIVDTKGAMGTETLTR
jgi:hypothetical protein